MIPVVTKESAKQVQVGDAWACIELNSDAKDAPKVELVRVDFSAEVATIRYLGRIMSGPLMIRSDHPDFMGQEVAVLFV